jgi:5-deoxy-glucuronate isomerase
MVVRGRTLAPGYTEIRGADGVSDPPLMDFAVLRLSAGDSHRFAPGRERALLVLSGELELAWEGRRATVSRSSLFDQGPWCLHLPSDAEASARARGGDVEISIHSTANPARFAPRLYGPDDCRNEERGKGTMRETSTRIIRTILEDPGAAHSNLVLGEVITFPGKWSSYPPHHHPQPEIYHYRFQPGNGFGFAGVGDEALVVRSGDTVFIPPGAVHPQAAAPGYAMYYLWVIRHLDGNRYGAPTFVPQHTWVTDPKATIWP